MTSGSLSRNLGNLPIGSSSTNTIKVSIDSSTADAVVNITADATATGGLSALDSKEITIGEPITVTNTVTVNTGGGGSGGSGGGGGGRGGGTGGNGFCRGFFGATGMTPQDEEAILTNRASVLERELAAARERLETLKKDANGET